MGFLSLHYFPWLFRNVRSFRMPDSPGTTPKIAAAAAGQRPWRRLMLKEADKNYSQCLE